MKPKPLTRPSELVLSAIYNLDEANGSSTQDIVQYISGNYNINAEEIKQNVEAALKRGLSFGLILRDTSGLYKLRDITELPDIAPPQRQRRKRKKLARSKKEGKAGSSDAKFDETSKRKNESFSGCDRFKRARLEAGESSCNHKAKLDASFACTNITNKF